MERVCHCHWRPTNSLDCVYLAITFDEILPISGVWCGSSSVVCIDRMTEKEARMNRLMTYLYWPQWSSLHITHRKCTSFEFDCAPFSYAHFQPTSAGQTRERAGGKEARLSISLSSLPALSLCLTGEIVWGMERVRGDHVLLWLKRLSETIAIPAHEWSFNFFLFLAGLCVFPVSFDLSMIISVSGQ